MKYSQRIKTVNRMTFCHHVIPNPEKQIPTIGKQENKKFMTALSTLTDEELADFFLKLVESESNTDDPEVDETNFNKAEFYTRAALRALGRTSEFTSFDLFMAAQK